MWEASHSVRTSAPPERVWALWAGPAGWPEWNERIERVEVDGAFELGTALKVKQKGGGTLHAKITALDPGRAFTYEARLPGARLGYEHEIASKEEGAEISNRVYISGALSGLWRLMMGRRAAQALPAAVERQRELAEAA